MDQAERVAGAMAAGVAEPDIQLAQTRFRLNLVRSWGIRPGASVLEVGCGQGDMTAALAEAVGPAGRVLGVDPAPASYGSPVTLGESAGFLRASPLGDRLELRFDFDVRANSFADNTFDEVVLCHCGWYFGSLAQLESTLEHVRPWARRLRFAEWELAPTSLRQLPHLLAVLIQGQFEAAGSRGSGNIRTPFSHEALRRVLATTGWRVVADEAMDTTGLQDADWEIAAALAMLDERRSLVPDAVRDLVDSLADQLRATAGRSGNPPLPSYAITAE